MGAWCIDPEHRATYLRGRLQPEHILRDLTSATQPNRRFVELIGIKAAVADSRDFERTLEPEFKLHIETDPEIAAILEPYRAMGFNFIWTGYFDPTGVETSYAIERNPAAEEQLRALLASGRAHD